ncbi:MAG TPA: PhzF family phenazine biosynthesis protein [Spirochaetota bacterium]|nr:PhzF family phenazine biosynthesis protein [Spirochaetota bacterium]HPV42683.1 PhzF family phenazine biosynthesis protein [Spirochaetota bacterium]
MGERIYHVDAFSERPFAGNPAGVCLLDGPKPDAWLRAVAREMNLSETAFLLEEGEGYSLRWFTPATEVELCGHATLAAAHILWETGRLPGDATAVFRTLSGALSARRSGEWIIMDFPAEEDTPADVPESLVRALGGNPRYAGKNRFDYILEFGSEEEIRDMRPDFKLLGTVPCRGVIVTAATAGEYDFVSRFFAPAVGVDEDPVTGSAHCCLGPFWGRRLGRASFTARQVSARGGTVRVEVRGGRVMLGGRAVTVMEGEVSL